MHMKIQTEPISNKFKEEADTTMPYKKKHMLTKPKHKAVIKRAKAKIIDETYNGHRSRSNYSLLK